MLNLAKRKTGYLHPYQAYMALFRARVMPVLKEQYTDYLRTLDAGATPMSELAFNAKTAKELLAQEPRSTHDAIEFYRNSKRRRAGKNLLDSVLKEGTPDDEDMAEGGEGDEKGEVAVVGGELLADLLR